MPAQTPRRVALAHQSLLPIYEFLQDYETRMQRADGSQCDFALGNPQTMPLPGFVDTLRDSAVPRSVDWFAYKASEPSCRSIIQTTLNQLTDRDYQPEDVFLTNGATGALLVTMNALIETGDEVIYCDPPWFFYEGMILNCGGMPVSVNVDPLTYDLDLTAIEKAISDRTRMVIVNSPHNPTGKVYSPDTLNQLADLLRRASGHLGRPIYLISDEAYRTVVFDDRAYPSPTNHYEDSILIYTYGKTLLTPGQRIGYIAISPEAEERIPLRELIASSQILCGWAMSSALMQHGLSRLEKLSLDISDLQSRRDRLVSGLQDVGYEVNLPEGAFYVLPKTPIDDDRRFATHLAERGVHCLPGHIIQMPGHLRMSITASADMIEKALPIFALARTEFANR